MSTFVGTFDGMTCGDMELHYTMHRNWEWVLKEALDKSSSNCSFSRYVQYPSMRQLPSQIHPSSIQSQDTVPKRKANYSLFRFEIVAPSSSSSGDALSDPEKVSYDACRKCCWLSAQTFGFIDPKDFLYKCFERAITTAKVNNDSTLYIMPMPLTHLIPWDVESIDQIPAVLPSSPTSLLKAALGSGGHGIYFVQNRQQVLDIVKRDATIARGEGGANLVKDGSASRQDSTFIASLKRDHGGSVPQWSLQQYINSVRVFADAQRCQFRVYVVYCNREHSGGGSRDGGHMYMYDSVEVRVPRWEGDDLDSFVFNHNCAADKSSSSSSSSSSSGDCTRDEGNEAKMGDVREYNAGRDKQRTHRYVLDELQDDFVSTTITAADGNVTHTAPVTKKVLLDACSHAMHLLRADFEANNAKLRETLSDYSCPYPLCSHDTDTPPAIIPPPVMMAIAGIDLLVDQFSGQAYIVEFNNNPALPGSHKGMTVPYRQHLIHLMQDLMILGGIFSLNDDNVNAGSIDGVKATNDSACFGRPSKLLQLW